MTPPGVGAKNLRRAGRGGRNCPECLMGRFGGDGRQGGEGKTDSKDTQGFVLIRFFPSYKGVQAHRKASRSILSDEA